MRVVYERCCGLDIHKKSVVTCMLITLETGEVQRHLRTFSTMTAGLLALADWLESQKAHGCGDGINRGVHASPNVANWGRFHQKGEQKQAGRCERPHGSAVHRSLSA